MHTTHLGPVTLGVFFPEGGWVDLPCTSAELHTPEAWYDNIETRDELVTRFLSWSVEVAVVTRTPALCPFLLQTAVLRALLETC